MPVHKFHLKLRNGCNLYASYNSDNIGNPEHARLVYDFVGLPRRTDAAKIQPWLDRIYLTLAAASNTPIRVIGDPMVEFLSQKRVPTKVYQPDGAIVVENAL